MFGTRKPSRLCRSIQAASLRRKPRRRARARVRKSGASILRTSSICIPRLLYLRSQPLQDRSVQRIVVYPATSAYLATVTVLGRERLTGPAGTYNAIKLDLQLSKIGKNRELEPHRKFRRGTVWLSDDSDRLLLRIQAQIFVGTVFAELQSVEFENAKPGPVRTNVRQRWPERSRLLFTAGQVDRERRLAGCRRTSR